MTDFANLNIKLNLSGHLNQPLADLGFTFPGTIQINPETPYQDNFLKIVEFLRNQGINSESVVTIALPGMSTLASMVILGVHGITGQFPFITPLIRNEEGQFIAGRTADLQLLRNNVARANRNDIRTL